MVEDERFVVDEDAIEQKPDEQEDDRHCPHCPVRCLHVLAVPCSERDEAEHDHPEDEHLVLQLDRHRHRLAFTPTLCSYLCYLSFPVRTTAEHGRNLKLDIKEFYMVERRYL